MNSEDHPQVEESKNLDEEIKIEEPAVIPEIKTRVEAPAEEVPENPADQQEEKKDQVAQHIDENLPNQAIESNPDHLLESEKPQT